MSGKRKAAAAGNAPIAAAVAAPAAASDDSDSDDSAAFLAGDFKSAASTTAAGTKTDKKQKSKSVSSTGPRVPTTAADVAAIASSLYGRDAAGNRIIEPPLSPADEKFAAGSVMEMFESALAATSELDALAHRNSTPESSRDAPIPHPPHAAGYASLSAGLALHVGMQVLMNANWSKQDPILMRFFGLMLTPAGDAIHACSLTASQNGCSPACMLFMYLSGAVGDLENAILISKATTAFYVPKETLAISEIAQQLTTERAAAKAATAAATATATATASAAAAAAPASTGKSEVKSNNPSLLFSGYRDTTNSDASENAAIWNEFQALECGFCYCYQFISSEADNSLHSLANCVSHRFILVKDGSEYGLVSANGAFHGMEIRKLSGPKMAEFVYRNWCDPTPDGWTFITGLPLTVKPLRISRNHILVRAMKRADAKSRIEYCLKVAAAAVPKIVPLRVTRTTATVTLLRVKEPDGTTAAGSVSIAAKTIQIE